MANKSEFEKGLDDLHQGAGRITSGLEKIVEMIDGVARDNELYIKGAGATAEDSDSQNIRTLIEGIRNQITDVVDLGHQFENRIDAYGTELSDLNTQLETARNEATTDPLTGIANRREFENTLRKILSGIETFNNQVSVLLSDVDDFKRINDSLGHNIGDQVLRLVAENFTNNLKGSDTVARWGGDEFAAILPHTSLDNAVAVADSMRDSLAKKTLKQKGSDDDLGHITLSIGVSAYRQGDTAHKMVLRADKAMHAAKDSGKNRTVGEED